MFVGIHIDGVIKTACTWSNWNFTEGSKVLLNRIRCNRLQLGTYKRKLSSEGTEQEDSIQTSIQ